MLVLLLIPAVVLAGGALALAWWSHRANPAVGLVGGRLRSCPDTRNCVSSESGTPERSAVAPIKFADDSASAWARAKAAIVAAGGHIEYEIDGYLWATLRTPVLRFIDDVELRLVREQRVIHVRSASRIGRSDLGKNRRRVDDLRVRCAAP
jgi:uncharacterized protein (DUF1499 family)